MQSQKTKSLDGSLCKPKDPTCSLPGTEFTPQSSPTGQSTNSYGNLPWHGAFSNSHALDDLRESKGLNRIGELGTLDKKFTPQSSPTSQSTNALGRPGWDEDEPALDELRGEGGLSAIGRGVGSIFGKSFTPQSSPTNQSTNLTSPVGPSPELGHGASTAEALGGVLGAAMGTVRRD